MGSDSAKIRRLSKAIKFLRKKQHGGDTSSKTASQLKKLSGKLKKIPIGDEEGGR